MHRYPTAIIWDLDGTLVDSAPDLARALNQLLAEQQLAALSQSDIRSMIGDGVAALIERGFAAHGIPPEQLSPGTLLPRFLSVYSDCLTTSTRLYPGAREVLEHFAVAGVRQGVCTNKPEKLARRILCDLGIADRFGVIIGGDSLPSRKPDPLPLRAALAALDAAPCESLMIGDSAVDVAMARAESVSVAIVSFGYSRVPVATLDADFLIADFASIPALICAAHC